METYWTDVRVEMKQVLPVELWAEDRVWYFIRRSLKSRGPADCHGPFVVHSVTPFKLTNTNGVTLTLNPDNLLLVVPVKPQLREHL